MDSLVVAEICRWIAKEMESTVPILELLASSSLTVLAAEITYKL